MWVMAVLARRTDERSARLVRVRSLREPSSRGIIDVNGVGKPVDDLAPGKDAVDFFFFFFVRLAYDVREARDSRFAAPQNSSRWTTFRKMPVSAWRIEGWKGGYERGLRQRSVGQRNDRSRPEEDRRTTSPEKKFQPVYHVCAGSRYPPFSRRFSHDKRIGTRTRGIRY